MRRNDLQTEDAGRLFSRRELLKKAAQGAVVLGSLGTNIPQALAGAPLAVNRQQRVKDLAYRGLADQNFLKLLQTNPAAALGKPGQALTQDEQADVNQALQEIRRVQTEPGSGGPCGIAMPAGRTPISK